MTTPLYRLPKIHKKDLPLRFIISMVNSPKYNLAKYLTCTLKSYKSIGQMNKLIKDFQKFISKTKGLFLEEIYRTDIPGEHCQIVQALHFSWNNKIYGQSERMVRGSLLNLVVANFYLGKFEKQAIKTALHKPVVWFRYVDATFVVWRHAREISFPYIKTFNL